MASVEAKSARGYAPVGSGWEFGPSSDCRGLYPFERVRYAGLAQWQCSGFVNRRSGVRIPHPAPRKSMSYREKIWTSGIEASFWLTIWLTDGRAGHGDETEAKVPPIPAAPRRPSAPS